VGAVYVRAASVRGYTSAGHGSCAGQWHQTAAAYHLHHRRLHDHGQMYARYLLRNLCSTGLPHHTHARSHTHPFNGPFSGTTQVSRYQTGNPIWILLKQETVNGSGISWAACKSASRSRQTTTPLPHHSAFCRPDALPAAQPTVSKH